MPNDIFKEQISARLQHLIDGSPSTVIILVPSVRDVVSRHVAFPQAMLEKDVLGLPKASLVCAAATCYQSSP